jgi:heptosyltransferase-2/heptosyltransferase-3
MWEGNPNLDELLTVRFPGIAFRNEGGPLGSYMLLGKVARDLAAQRYDLGVILRFDHWWGAGLMWAAGIPRRWGYFNPLTARWLTSKVPYAPGRHEVEQDVRLAQAVINSAAPQKISEVEVDQYKGIPALLPPAPVPPEQEAANAWLKSERRAIVHPGTGAANKLWTISGWAEVANKLSEEGWSLALTGSPGEKPLCDAIVEATGNAKSIANLAGQTSGLGQLAWLLDRAGMVLGVDSGPLHIAAALGRPTIHLYGPSDESIWGPWGDPDLHRAFRAPGTHPTMRLDVTSQDLEGGPDMRAITPEMVMSQVAELEKYKQSAIQTL